MANKQYISPIRLFEHCSISYKNEINPGRIKKQLSAEFDFAKSGFIEIDGYSYNKHDIFEEIESENFVERLQYHMRLWSTKNLLAVLEDNSVSLNEIDADFSKYQNDAGFDKFFSPYFAGPFSYISRSLLNDRRLGDMGRWLRYEDFLQPEHQEEGFKPIRIFLEENIRLFKNISQENYNSFRSKISQWIDRDWDEFFNYLPEEFYHLKSEIIIDLINLTVKIQKNHKHDCKEISSKLVRLTDVPSNLHETIINNDKVFNGSGGGGTGGYGWIIWVVIIILRLITSGGCN